MMNSAEITLLLFLFVLNFQFSFSIDTISSNISIKDADGVVLISSGQTFAFGFFSAGNITSARRYVGIWYQKISEKTVVWVANRDNPVIGSSGVLQIDQGNLVLYAGNQTTQVWSTNISAPSNGSSKVQLMDSGNLVLLHQESDEVLWQSFDHPSDTMLPYMKLGVDRRTGFKWILSSWKSPDDPGTSNITYQIDPDGFPQLFVYKNSVPWWRGGPWLGERWAGVPEMTRNDLFYTSFVNNMDEAFLTYSMMNASVISRMMVDNSGYASRSTWNDHDGRWFEFWSAPKEQCDDYGYCGPNGYCDPYNANSFMCQCFPGFQPKSSNDWSLRDASGGCVRNSGMSMCRNREGFVKLALVKVPDTSLARADLNMNLKECEQECYRNCSCSAYSSAAENGTGCLMWFGDLTDTRTYSGIGQDLYIRVDSVELAKHRSKKGPFSNRGVQATVIVLIVIAVFLILFLVRWWIRRNKRAMKTINSFISFSRKEFDESGGKDLPVFDLDVIAAATNDFSIDNKLGEGGFGSVYKGLLYGETEIAVKRLSQNSGQGTKEFKNEVSLIVKLQHRNLVKILGVCVQGLEKMLIYEFLPNKSLDYFIFEEKKRALLDWPTRFNIICGIARGILYLHQDSRLKIIHRDLKASNVLLDASMSPKISDFGMARIFGVDQNEANTNRVVGTYGYMSPEYAMQGLFSVKSDVYSFGVLLLEIITGRKNTTYFGEISHLIGYVWELGKEDREMDAVDPLMDHSYADKEIQKCIKIGLLCVQESPTDRPNMSQVVLMLGNDNGADLPCPKQPAAFVMQRAYNSRDASTSGGVSSANEVSITMTVPR